MSSDGYAPEPPEDSPGLRRAMFEYLDKLASRHEGRVPHARLTTDNFEYENRTVRLIEPRRGILKPASWGTVLTLKSTSTSVARGGYDDHRDGNRIKYKFMRPSRTAGAYNEALLRTMRLGFELAFFWDAGPGWYIPEYPVIIEESHDDGVWISRSVVVGDA